jgi:hypothetical protein
MRKTLKDGEPSDLEVFKQELADIFVYLIQASIASKMKLAQEFDTNACVEER